MQSFVDLFYGAVECIFNKHGSVSENKRFTLNSKQLKNCKLIKKRETSLAKFFFVLCKFVVILLIFFKFIWLNLFCLNLNLVILNSSLTKFVIFFLLIYFIFFVIIRMLKYPSIWLYTKSFLYLYAFNHFYNKSIFSTLMKRLQILSTQPLSVIFLCIFSLR